MLFVKAEKQTRVAAMDNWSFFAQRVPAQAAPLALRFL